MLSLRADDIELVAVAICHAGYEYFPVASAADPHGMSAAIPKIEIANDANALCVRREDDKRHATDAFHAYHMRAELVEKALMSAFSQQVQIEICQDRRKIIGIAVIGGCRNA